MPSTDAERGGDGGRGSGGGGGEGGGSGRDGGNRGSGRTGGEYIPRLRRIARHEPRVRAALLGFALGVLAVPLLVLGAGWPLREASSTTFALGALVLGFAVLAWVAAILTGPAVETMQEHLTFGAGWTEAEARQAFAILIALGAGVMLGSVLATRVVSLL